ncbi:Hsp90 co-chaperone Cdc37 [Cordyceps militaris CM01]|uniref:Hsp90 chaperone protein kinase-targeting subunit n=1 Tax=Cordyceps militaris (strain CM01) TaxID=983644 RepID=G3JQV2_CORMM|nr:Hsp90 co-chaperone Cdc37 [Cordyceps militaris CM01]EGX89128.1 Hsp90 co-chaperone Cdc37 [Cordyceps militaris CM01]
MVDYRKWDSLELSDDSDIEVHPNVDKRSFIRAKQNQIHAEREQRKRQVEALEYERIINETLSQRLISLISLMKTHTTGKPPPGSPSDAAFKAAMQLMASDVNDQPPSPPEGLFVDVPNPTYSNMIFRILDEVKRNLDERRIDQHLQNDAFLEELGVQLQSIQEVQEDIAGRLDKLQAEKATKITSESYRTGFNSSHLNKAIAQGSQKLPASPELLNPDYDLHGLSNSSSSIALPENEDGLLASPAALAFAEIQSSNYRASHAYILSHPEILEERETDGLLIEAYNAAIENEDGPKPLQYVHQAMLLQCCRMLGRDGVNIFFKRMTTPGHRSIEFFDKDVAEKLQRIRELARDQRKAQSEGVEQIQIRAVDPGTEIQIRVPELGSEERVIFEQLAPDMQAALESGLIDRVNEVLGVMDVVEAEQVIDLLGEANCLNIEEEIIDATTEEGKRHLKEIQESTAADTKDAGAEIEAEDLDGVLEKHPAQK